MPTAISVEPTTACNLRCPECPSGIRSFTRPTGNLSSHTFNRVLDDLSDYLTYLIFYFQGEPFIHPKFSEMVAAASKRNIFTATSTNGHFLTEENCEKILDAGLDQIIISIDGTSQEVYESYRKEGNLEKVLAGAERLVSMKKRKKAKRPHTIFQFLVVKPNESQIPDVYALAKKMGIDEVRLKTAQIYDYEDGSDLIPEQEKYSRYKLGKDGKYHIKGNVENHCWKMWHSCVITWDGKVVPCCFDKDAHYVLGNIQEKSFREIWEGPAYQNFRQQLLRSRSEIEMCKNCTEGTTIWA